MINIQLLEYAITFPQTVFLQYSQMYFSGSTSSDLIVFLVHLSLQVNNILVQLLVEHPVHEQHPPHSQQHGRVRWGASAAGENTQSPSSSFNIKLLGLPRCLSSAHIFQYLEY